MSASSGSGQFDDPTDRAVTPSAYRRPDRVSLPLLQVPPPTDDPSEGGVGTPPRAPARALQRRLGRAPGSLKLGTAVDLLLRPVSRADRAARCLSRHPGLRGDGLPGHVATPGPGLPGVLPPVPDRADPGVPPISRSRTVRLAPMGRPRRLDTQRGHRAAPPTWHRPREGAPPSADQGDSQDDHGPS